MAQLPHFVFSPSTLISAIGFMRGPDRTPATSVRDWRTVTVDVVIPARNEQDNIVRCLASVLGQTLQPRTIVVVDDGSTDETAARARACAEFHGVNIRVVRRLTSIGKTPTIKEQARTLDSDVLFVLDADTLLESNTYIERMVEELYQGVGIASACGSILPLRERDRRSADELPAALWFAQAHPSYEPARPKRWWRRLASGITNTYREVAYLFVQRVVLQGHMAIFGTVSNTAGCAVAYRRAYLEALFDTVEPQLGDDPTNSEDIIIGLGMLDLGYRNVQVLDVLARTVGPEVVACAAATPAPVSELFSAMTNLTASVPRVWAPAVAGAGFSGGERRRIQEPYRQAFGSGHTGIYGRRAERVLLASAVERIAFPTMVLLMLIFRNWEGLLITIGAETWLAVMALTFVMKGRRLEYLAKGIAVAPLRYALLAFEAATIVRVASDLWPTRNRRQRKPF